MAVILTLTTAPLTLLLYPPAFRKIDHTTYGSTSDTSDEKAASRLSTIPSLDKGGKARAPSAPSGDKSKFTVVLEHIEHLPAVMTIVQLLQPTSSSSSDNDASVVRSSRPTKIDALRLIELSERMSTVMRGSGAGEVLRRDALVKVFEMFARLNRILVSSSLSVVPYANYAPSVVEHAHVVGSEMILLPWSAAPSSTSSEGEPNVAHSSTSHAAATPLASYNPFLNMFGTHESETLTEKSVLYSQFIRGVFAESSVDVALIVDRGSLGSINSSHRISVDGYHIFLPFFGGPDDRLALNFLVQLCHSNPSVSATVLWVTKSEDDPDRSETVDSIAKKAIPHQNFTITSIVSDTLLHLVNSTS